MKHLKHLLALILALVLLSAPAMAGYRTSGWAESEVDRAERRGLLAYRGLPEDLTQAVTRREFCRLAMQYLAVSSRCDGTFYSLVGYHMTEHTDEYPPRMKYVFTDGDYIESYAYYVGLVLGDGSGRFRPDDTITRQEVAVILLRAYTLLGGTVPETAEAAFPDAAEIADWALEAASVLTDWGVLKGHSDGSFDPEGLCTVEQAIALIQRLDDSAPEAAKPIFSEAECREWLESDKGNNLVCFVRSLLAEGEQADVVREDMTGVMGGVTSFYLVYHGGGIAELNLGVWDAPYGPTQSLVLDDPKFSEDGMVFTCSATVKKDVYDMDGSFVFEAGTYHITVHVNDPYHVSTVKQ